MYIDRISSRADRPISDAILCLRRKKKKKQHSSPSVFAQKGKQNTEQS
jgi:hypothetical protein